MRVLLASTNQHKAREYQRLFAGNDLDVRTPAEWDLPPLTVEETGLTFAANALTKARAYASAYRMPTLADDSGICVDPLAGAPGVRSARFGRPGLDAEGRARYLLDCLKGIWSPIGARTTCARWPWWYRKRIRSWWRGSGMVGWPSSIWRAEPASATIRSSSSPAWVRQSQG